MKRGLWLVFTWLVTTALLLVSCGQNVPETSSKVEEESEIAVSAPVETPGPKPASFTVSGLTISPAEVTSASSVTIEVLVTNDGELSGTYDVTLKIDEKEEATETVTLEGGTNQKVIFRVTKSTAKTYSVNVDGQSGTFTVKARPASTVVQPPPPSLPDMDDFMKGMAFSDWAWDIMPRPPMIGELYNPSLAEDSLKRVAATGANWISLLVNGTQESYKSTKVTRDENVTASDEALKHVIDYAHSLGMRVILHPALFSLPNTPGISWIEIGTSFTSETQWQEWFTSYREFINHYATLAQESGADMFYVGSELAGTTRREADWRRVIKEVRERYKGPISYDSVFWGPIIPEFQRITWWDAVDYIAVDCWHSLTDKNNPTVEELKAGLIRTGYVTDLENISKRFKKPVIISEIGYDSLDGTARDYFNTHSGGGPEDLQEQADCYQAALEVFWGKPWLKGIFWWQWNAISLEWLETPQDKPAEQVLKQFYLQK